MTSLLKPLSAATAALALATASLPASADFDRLIQASLGALTLEDQDTDLTREDGSPAEMEFPTLPTLGVDAEYRFGGDYLAWGVNPGGSIAWKSSGAKIAGSIGGDNGAIIGINIDNSLFLGELHLGAYLRARLGQSVTWYASAGPMLLYGRLSVEDEDAELPENMQLEESEDSDFAAGFYGRMGLDFAISGEQSIGMGVRYMKTELDFDDTIGSVDLEGPQVFLSYTVPL